MMKIEIVEDTLTTWVDGSIKYLSNSRVKDILIELIGSIYEIVEPSVPLETGYLRASGRDDWIIEGTAEAMGINMIFSGEKNPPSNRAAHGHTEPPIYPDKPYALHQYLDVGRPWFHQHWSEIEETVMLTAENEYDMILGGWF